MSHHVFTYGSLMFPEVWSRVVAGDYRALSARLDGYARFEVRDQTYPGMVPQQHAHVAGVLYLDVDGADLARLDEFEGDDYLRVSCDVSCDDGVARPAQTYVFRLPAGLLKTEWRPDAFAMQRFLETYCRDKLDRRESR